MHCSSRLTPPRLGVWAGFLLLGLALCSSDTQADSFEVLPAIASPGSEIIVRGTGLPGFETLIIEMDSTSGQLFPLGTLDSDGDGSIFGRLTVPDAPSGTYRVKALEGSALVGTTNLNVSTGPALVLQPSTAPPGTVVTATFGPTAAGTVRVFYDGVTVVGPIQHGGGVFESSFIVPSDRPDPLGSVVDVRAELVSGGSLSAAADALFRSQAEEPDEVSIVQFSGPTEPLTPGERFNFSGRVQVPSFRSVRDYQWTLAMETNNGQLVPVNVSEIAMSPNGDFSGEAVAPSIIMGVSPQLLSQTTRLGLVYKPADTGNGTFLEVGTIAYEDYGLQQFTVNVIREDDGSPIQSAFVMISGPWVVPQDWTFGGGSPGNTRAGDTTQNKSTWSAMYTAPNQYQEWVQDFVQNQLQNANEVTDCPVTLSSGLTDAAGNWSTNSAPWLSEAFDTVAQDLSDIALGTVVNGPGFATYSVRVSALHEGLGLTNDNGICSGQRFDFRYDYGKDQWFQRSTLDGPFDSPFDPNQPFQVALPECDGQLSIPADPSMPGVPVQEIETVIFGPGGSSEGRLYQFGPIWSFRGTTANLTIQESLELNLPHLSALFGTLDNARLIVEGVDLGPLEVSGSACGTLGQNYSINLDQFVFEEPGLYTGRIEATMLNGQPVSKTLRFDIRQGPTWIEQGEDYLNRTINWKPDEVRLLATEPMRDEEVNQTLGYGIGSLHNSNVSQALITQAVFPSGAASQTRFGDAASTAANENNEPVQQNASISGSFGSQTPINVLDTGKMPLFRYAFGVPPIASATVGCDVWFAADYAYYGNIVLEDEQVLVNATTEAIARAGLDVWLDGSILFDLVSLTGYGLPNFELTMPLVVTNNEFNSAESQPCFEFALDVAWEAQLGWCPFCIKGGDITNLFAVDEPDGCSFPFREQGNPTIDLPSIPPIDRTSLAVDGLGEASLVWGDGTAQLQVQQFRNGQAMVREVLPTGPGAMGADSAYLGLNRQVMVWSQNSLSEADFRALDGDIRDPLDGDFNTGLRTQHLVYRVRDLSGWSDIMPLTLPGGGDGGVVLAACPSQQAGCPQGGEVLAVWVHDASGDINRHDFKLRYAFFDGFSWSPIRDVDSGTLAKDVQPAVTYLNGDPVVFWVRNPSVVRNGSSATFDLNERRIAYRFLRQFAGVQEPTELPLGVASPSIEAFGTDSLILAFSKATESDAFLGTRRSLNTAYATACSGGICQFTGADEILDSNGRRLFVERPKVAVNAQNQAIVTFRQLGIDNATENDPIGVLQNTGALMQLGFNLDPLAVPQPYDPFELSNSGAVNWRVDAIFDPAANAVLTSTVQVDDFFNRGAEAAKAPIKGVREQRFAGDNGALVFVERPMLPDFEVLSAAVESERIDPDTGTTLTVRLRNNGPTPAGAVTLATYWNGPPGLGIPGPDQVINDLPSSQVQDVPLSITLPRALNPDDRHTLHVVINPNVLMDESDGSNNELQLVVNALEVPTHLVSYDEDNSGIITIHWDPVSDPRVTGYRVYRRNPDGSVLNLGVSTVPGFADFSAYPDQRYEYFVTSYTVGLSESDPSEAVPALTFNQDLVFRDGFE
jgi:hypothetical protein